MTDDDDFYNTMSAEAAAQSVNPARPSPMLVALRARPELLGPRSIPTSLATEEGLVKL